MSSLFYQKRSAKKNHNINFKPFSNDYYLIVARKNKVIMVYSLHRVLK